MKKIKVIGLATAALLAVSPVVASVTPVNTTVSAATTNPYIYYNGVAYDSDITIDASSAAFAHIPLNGSIDINAIQNAFSAPGMKLDIDTTNVENRIASSYPVTVTATNMSTAAKTRVTFHITVGEQHDLKTVEGAPDTVAAVYQISPDGTISDTGIGIKNDTKVSTYGNINVDGKVYTRLNSANSDLYIKSGWFNGSYTDNTNAEPTTKFIMHKSLIYDQNGNKTGGSYRAFRNVDVYPDTVNIKGTDYYRVVDTLKFINAANIDGTERTLTHNAYVYATSKTRANKKVLKKGSKITTYGSSYKFVNGKRYYRIGTGKQYVKTSNFK
ncbi:pore-forming S-layer protein SlpA [Lactobacillus hamsteri]|uniref:Surface layer protein slpc n=1 Tax=Lactobacillus hamsteri DSM 5661 = JCM 6256 TaxID=1423754 RepID=A0A0R1YF90_9LACO|nr:SLAP domain-containing protein [Lactobacillus hamsteri]KRM37715.1 surface layer protein slpc [Lactobacillus hamsteri DSM 5661 = JCM 6256]